jgi:hypothetical protein
VSTIPSRSRIWSYSPGVIRVWMILAVAILASSIDAKTLPRNAELVLALLPCRQGVARAGRRHHRNCVATVTARDASAGHVDDGTVLRAHGAVQAPEP